jgi:polyferredoxin
MSLVSSIVAATLFAWPWLRVANGEQALLWLVVPHTFLRFIGLSFLIPGVA